MPLSRGGGRGNALCDEGLLVVSDDLAGGHVDGGNSRRPRDAVTVTLNAAVRGNFSDAASAVVGIAGAADGLAVASSAESYGAGASALSKSDRAWRLDRLYDGTVALPSNNQTTIDRATLPSAQILTKAMGGRQLIGMLKLS